MKSNKITTLLQNKYPKAGDAKVVKVRDYNDLKDDFDALRPNDTTVKADTISEVTSGAGVTVDGVLFKDGAVSAGSSKVTEKTIEVALTAANLIAMYTTPVEVVAAVDGAALNFKSAVLIYDSTATAFTGGGAITINYGSGGAACSTTLAATFLTGAGDKVWGLEKLNAAGGFTMPVNTSLTITNASGVFATGTGVCRLQITYAVHTTSL